MPTLCTKRPKLSSTERTKIEIFNNLGCSQSAIARELGRHKSTICRELTRYKDRTLYRAELAQHRADKCRARSHRHCKKHCYELLAFCERCLKKRWSPEIIAAKWNQTGVFTITHTTIYTIINTMRPE